MRIFFAVISALLLVVGCRSYAGSTPPNILLLVTDDIGWVDLGAQGSDDFVTPAIDSIASNGVRFTSGYVSGAKCSPSRAGFLTGRYQQRFGHENNVQAGTGLPVTQTLIPGHLKADGLDYRSYHVGKWHLGSETQFIPNSRSFDESFGFLGGFRSYFALGNPNSGQQLRRNNVQVAEPAAGAYLTDVWGDEAASYIDDHLANHSEKPFFMYCAFNGIHEPIEVSDQYLNDPRIADIADASRREIAAMTLAVDVQVGKLLTRLDAHGITNDTIVVFLNDNGGLTTFSDNGPLRSGKGSLLEGGIRVPFMIQWPGCIPAGQVIDDPVISLDLLPTFLAAALGSVPSGLETDGVNLLPRLTGLTSEPPHEILFWRTSGLLDERSAVRKGDWKLNRLDRNSGPITLHNLADDIGEAVDLANANPNKLQELLADLTAWECEIILPLWEKGAPVLTGATTVLHADLGYEVSNPDSAFGYAMNEQRLSLPLTHGWSLEFEMDLDAVASASTNGYVVLSDGDLANGIRLGIDLDALTLSITELQPDPDAVTVASISPPSGAASYRVVFDSTASTLTLNYGSQSVTHSLIGSYTAFSDQGYAISGATTQFSPIKTDAEIAVSVASSDLATGDGLAVIEFDIENGPPSQTILEGSEDLVTWTEVTGATVTDLGGGRIRVSFTESTAEREFYRVVITR